MSNGMNMIVLLGAMACVAVVVLLLGLVPGYIAQGKSRHRDIRILGLVGILIPFCWIAALIWAFMDKPKSK